MVSGRSGRSVPIDALRAFVTVVEVGGFTRAAERLGRPQPTISLQVKRLEEILQVPLFENSSRLQLSRAGEECLTSGIRLLDMHDRLITLVTRARADTSTRSVGVASELAHVMTVALTKTKREPDTGAAFDLMCADSPTVMQEFRNGRLDIAMAFARQGEPAAAERCWHAPLVWASARDFRLAEGRPVPLIACGDRLPYYSSAVAALDAARLRHEVVGAVSDFNGLRAAVASGVGASPMLLGSLTDGLSDLDTLRPILLPDLRVELHIKADMSFDSLPDFLNLAVREHFIVRDDR